MSKRSYQQFCGLARALDVVGERWTLLIVRNLLAGPQCYGELLGGLPGMTTNLLAKRLAEMQANELVVKDGRSYALANRGWDLEPAVMALAGFGQVYMAAGPGEGDTVELRWGMTSLKRRYQGKSKGLARFCIGERVFDLDFGPDYVGVTEHPFATAGSLPERALLIRCSFAKARGWLFQGKAPMGVTHEGSEALWSRLCSSFGLRADTV